MVVGSVIYRAVEALQAPGYDWGVLQAWRPPRYALDALPILAFGFQARLRGFGIQPKRMKWA